MVFMGLINIPAIWHFPVGPSVCLRAMALEMKDNPGIQSANSSVISSGIPGNANSNKHRSRCSITLHIHLQFWILLATLIQSVSVNPGNWHANFRTLTHESNSADRAGSLFIDLR